VARRVASVSTIASSAATLDHIQIGRVEDRRYCQAIGGSAVLVHRERSAATRSRRQTLVSSGFQCRSSANLALMRPAHRSSGVILTFDPRLRAERHTFARAATPRSRRRRSSPLRESIAATPATNAIVDCESHRQQTCRTTHRPRPQHRDCARVLRQDAGGRRLAQCSTRGRDFADGAVVEPIH
jgi:hypothetical protein